MEELIKHKTRFNRKVFHEQESLKTDFQNFNVSWKAIKSISRTFCSSLYNELNMKQVIHKMIWKKHVHNASSYISSEWQYFTIKKYLH